MGPGRSLRKLWSEYRKRSADDPQTEEPPTRRFVTLGKWSSRYQWQARIDRAKEIADDEIAELEREARKQAILNSGFALQYERLASLQRLADLLEEEIYEEDKRWLPDVKQIGAGDMAERVDIVRFNRALIEQFRQTLDDIAAEMGERVKGLELSGRVGIASITADDLAQARDEVEDWEDGRFGDLGEEAADEESEEQDGTGDR